MCGGRSLGEYLGVWLWLVGKPGVAGFDDWPAASAWPRFLAAELRGWERRWNYGYLISPERYTGSEVSSIDTVVALGIVLAPSAVMNGVIASVSDSELARLDKRERRYERVDVTDAVELLEGNAAEFEIDAVITYVPTDAPVADYVDGRDRGRAGIEVRYWDLVTTAGCRTHS